jgi:hypothetical protein
MLDILSMQNFLFCAAFVGPDFSFGSSEPIEPGLGRILIHNQCFTSGFIDS